MNPSQARVFRASGGARALRDRGQRLRGLAPLPAPVRVPAPLAELGLAHVAVAVVRVRLPPVLVLALALVALVALVVVTRVRVRGPSVLMFVLAPSFAVARRFSFMVVMVRR